MSLLTLYEMWKLYKYARSMCSTYETAISVYGTACTLVAATGIYVIPTQTNKESYIYIENKDGWEMIDIL